LKEPTNRSHPIAVARCVRACEREIVFVCVRERERERESCQLSKRGLECLKVTALEVTDAVCVCESVCVCVCLCVCVCKRKRERERERERENCQLSKKKI